MSLWHAPQKKKVQPRPAQERKKLKNWGVLRPMGVTVEGGKQLLHRKGGGREGARGLGVA